MRAALLAAGEGSRLRPHFGGPKPLFPLLGVPLILRNILALREAGIDQFMIITGHQAETLRDALGDGSDWNVSITYVHNDRWQLGNGVSAQAFRQVYQPGEKFLLLMADHQFQPGLFQRFISDADQLQENEVLLAVDRRLNQVHDLEECTKVAARENIALRLGKALSDYDAVDCGLFLATGALLDALDQAIDQGQYGLTDGVNRLAQQGQLKVHDVEHAWVDVDDAASVAPAEHMLLRSAVPKKDGFISRHINRKVSLRLTRKLAHTGVTPNQISLFSFFICFLSAGAFALGFPLLGGLLAQLGSILDGVDGEIARLTYQQSLYGELLDSILDRYADFFIIAGLSFWWLTHSDHHVAVLFISLIALSGQPMSMLIKEKYRNLTGKAFIPEQEDGPFHYLPTNRDGRLFLIMLGGLFHQIPATLVALALLTHGQTMIRLVRLKRRRHAAGWFVHGRGRRKRY